MAHNNTVLAQFLKLVPRHEFFVGQQWNGIYTDPPDSLPTLTAG